MGLPSLPMGTGDAQARAPLLPAGICTDGSGGTSRLCGPHAVTAAATAAGSATSTAAVMTRLPDAPFSNLRISSRSDDSSPTLILGERAHRVSEPLAAALVASETRGRGWPTSVDTPGLPGEGTLSCDVCLSCAEILTPPLTHRAARPHRDLASLRIRLEEPLNRATDLSRRCCHSWTICKCAACAAADRSCSSASPISLISFRMISRLHPPAR
mmetsp:Transcript_21019/g.64234  ORF Transcript_21019/g.64234 Transcript_21019/m.64234 type:complete len:214 (-) Transcript_21019:247-888(-)